MIRKEILFKENEKLKRQVFIFQNIGVSVNATVREKEDATKRFLKANPDYNLYEIAKAIKINRGTLYNYLFNKVEKTTYEKRKESIAREIIEIFNDSKKLYGAGKIVIALKKKGIITSKRYVAKVMKENNLITNLVVKKKKPYVNTQKQTYYRNLLRQQFEQKEPNKVWTSDFLEINVKGVKFYLCVILDLFARKVVGWRLSTQLNENLAINTFKDAFSSRNEPIDLMFHSDQGAQFKSTNFMNLLKMLGVKQSFSQAGKPYDNACMEGFYSKLRSEEINININNYENSKVIKEYLSAYFTFYNTQRIHTSNKGLTPDEKEEEYYKSVKNRV